MEIKRQKENIKKSSIMSSGSQIDIQIQIERKKGRKKARDIVQYLE